MVNDGQDLPQTQCATGSPFAGGHGALPQRITMEIERATDATSLHLCRSYRIPVDICVGITVASAHEDHGTFSAGQPGDPKKPARIIKVKMFEGSGKMGYEPARIEVRQGEQIRFVLQNDGEEDHEFVLATVPEQSQARGSHEKTSRDGA
jgi:plastocyanin